jgi:hypothetical protein
MGRKAIDPYKPKNLSACSPVIFFRSPENCHPARALPSYLQIPNDALVAKQKVLIAGGESTGGCRMRMP